MNRPRAAWAPWTPLLGVLFVVLAVLGLFVVGGHAPEAGTPGDEVLAYYEDNDAREIVASILGVLAAATLVFFGAHLRRVVLQTEPSPGFLATTTWGGALLLAAALGTAEGLHGALAIDPEYLTPASAEALHVLDQQFFFPTMLGFGVFTLSLGLAIARLRILPGWLGWVGVALGVVCLTPAAYFAILVVLVWLVVVSLLLARRAPAQTV